MQTKLVGNSINACTAVEAVANANMAFDPVGDTSIVSTSDSTTLLCIYNLQPTTESTHRTHPNLPAIKIAPRKP
jgi:hypothetical protein